MKGEKSDDQKNLETKIILLEDELLRCKNDQKIDSIRKELVYLRKKLQRMNFQRMGS